MRVLTASLLALFLLTGCAATDAQQERREARDDAKADRDLDRGEWLTCDNTTLGAAVRRWGGDREQFIDWGNFCNFQDLLPPQ